MNYTATRTGVRGMGYSSYLPRAPNAKTRGLLAATKGNMGHTIMLERWYTEPTVFSEGRRARHVRIIHTVHVPVYACKLQPAEEFAQPYLNGIVHATCGNKSAAVRTNIKLLD